MCFRISEITEDVETEGRMSVEPSVHLICKAVTSDYDGMLKMPSPAVEPTLNCLYNSPSSKDECDGCDPD